MLSEKKLKILDDFIDSTPNQRLKDNLNFIKSSMRTIEDEQLLLKIVNKKIEFSDTIIGIYEEYLNYIRILVLTEYIDARSYGYTFLIYKTDYDIYKQLLRFKKINNINKDVI